MNTTSPGTAYDRIATSYDDVVDRDRWVREELWKAYGNAFRPGEHILDVGCGTGSDTMRLIELGCSVWAIDASENMLAHLRRKAGDDDRLTVRRLNAEDIGSLAPERFDGIVSGFGCLNTVRGLKQFARSAASILKPRGQAIFHFVGPASLWERLHLVRTFNFTGAKQLGTWPERSFNIGDTPVLHHLLFPEVMYENNFEEHFDLADCFAMGALRPPPRFKDTAVLTNLLTSAERALRRRKPILNWGRFYVLRLRKRTAHPGGKAR